MKQDCFFDSSESLLQLPGVGPKRASALEAAGCHSVRDLLHHIPSHYQDQTQVATSVEVKEPGFCTLEGRLQNLTAIRLRGGRRVLIRGQLEDSFGSVAVRWLNRPYLLKQVSAEKTYRLYGEVKKIGSRLELTNADLREVPSSPPNTASPELVSLDVPLPEVPSPRVPPTELASSDRASSDLDIVPVYRSLGTLGPSAVATLQQHALELFRLQDRQDPLPEHLLGRHDLVSWQDAISRLHVPRGQDAVEDLNAGTTPGHQRLAYGELLEMAVSSLRARESRMQQRKAHRYELVEGGGAWRTELFPFPPTRAQKRVFDEIALDLFNPSPMARLLQGDVGSGKTAVAAQAILLALENGLQVAYMAPTELLAEQQFMTFQELFGGTWPVHLVTSSASSGSPSALSPADSSVAGLWLGTHALLEARWRFSRLGLVIIDEQHRFGVEQRRTLWRKGAEMALESQPFLIDSAPGDQAAGVEANADPDTSSANGTDLLLMTATPIPRTLTLSQYGDLELSILDEKPPGRQPIETRLLGNRRRGTALGWLVEALERGEQAYVVYPTIAAQGRGATLEKEGKALCQRLAAWSLRVLHGRQSRADRLEAIEAFAAGEVRVLLATTVIEVGLDVPNATFLMIEGAERFGLAQLHQLRGRIGRSHLASVCVALHGPLGAAAKHRLAAFEEHQDGFHLAKEDLRLRGKGDLIGSKQAGASGLAMADSIQQSEWLEKALEDAGEVVTNWSSPLYRQLRRQVRPRVEAWSRLGQGG